MALSAFLYSDQVIAENERIDRLLVDVLKGRRGHIGYIPSGPDGDGQFLRQKRDYYAGYGLSIASVYDLDRGYDRDAFEVLLACDAVHLSGGHTGQFLQRLRRSGIGPALAGWASDKGVLIGTSAGAILMTPTIAVDALFSGKRPVATADAAALDLIPFEFFPHFGADPTYEASLLRYSTVSPRPILACPDGSGAVVTDGKVAVVGRARWFAGGTSRPAHDFALADLPAVERR
jgi:dipeptidase E